MSHVVIRFQKDGCTGGLTMLGVLIISGTWRYSAGFFFTTQRCKVFSLLLLKEVNMNVD